MLAKHILYQLRYTPFYLYFNTYNANRIKNAIIKQNNPIASVNAKPKIVYLNNSCWIEGLRDKANTNEPNTVPTPAPAPPKPIVAAPAPINLQASNILYIYKLNYLKTL